MSASVISHVNTVAKARLFTTEFSQLSIFTADCLRHPIQMAGVETIWELHTLIVMNTCVNTVPRGLQCWLELMLSYVRSNQSVG